MPEILAEKVGVWTLGPGPGPELYIVLFYFAMSIKKSHSYNLGLISNVNLNFYLWRRYCSAAGISGPIAVYDGCCLGCIQYQITETVVTGLLYIETPLT